MLEKLEALINEIVSKIRFAKIDILRNYVEEIISLDFFTDL